MAGSFRTSNLFVRCQFVAMIVVAKSSFCLAEQSKPIDITDSIEFKSSRIDYNGPTTDVVSTLKRRMERGEISFTNRGRSGYLIDLLRALEISVSSQTLVFSKTSLQQEFINPKNPRALYFNDEVAVGFIPGSPVLEIAAHDPKKGAIFYTLAQPESGTPTVKVTFQREDRCIECHCSNATLGVPGYMLRSFRVDADGERELDGTKSEVTHATPFEKRWGGWYVTGRTNTIKHMGNLFGEDEFARHETESSFRGTLTDLRALVDLNQYPTQHSDMVALMVFEHQAEYYNLVTRIHYEHQMNVHSDAEERLARYAMMEDEAPLPGHVVGSTQYTCWYQSLCSTDRSGNEIRRLNLKTRLFEHRLSPMVKSRSFQCLPPDVKARLWKRIQAGRADIAGQLSPAEPGHRTTQTTQANPN